MNFIVGFTVLVIVLSFMFGTYYLFIMRGPQFKHVFQGMAFWILGLLLSIVLAFSPTMPDKSNMTDQCQHQHATISQ